MTTYFSPDQLAAIVKDALPPVLADGPRHAIVATIDQDGVKVVASFTRPLADGTWTLQAAATHDWTGDTTVAARVLLAW